MQDPQKPSEISHYPVLFREVLEHLPVECCRIFDGTLGHGGHARAILEARPDVMHYFGVDRDPDVISRFESNPTDPRLLLIHGNFCEVLQRRHQFLEDALLDAVFLDLGTSQYQLKNAARGFSFLREGPLDMRMNPKENMPLRSWLAEADQEEISDILLRFGEEKFHFRIARAIVENREKLHTTLDLASVIENCLPRSYLRKSPIHGATRSFQAFRIFINQELDSLEKALDQAVEALRPGGRILVISFHSLEDRIVKKRFQEWERDLGVPEFLRNHYPGSVKPRGRRFPRKAIFPGNLELSENEPSRSARLRVFIRGENG